MKTDVLMSYINDAHDNIELLCDEVRHTDMTQEERDVIYDKAERAQDMLFEITFFINEPKP